MDILESMIALGYTMSQIGLDISEITLTICNKDYKRLEEALGSKAHRGPNGRDIKIYIRGCNKEPGVLYVNTY